jgi:hypothetical protein
MSERTYGVVFHDRRPEINQDAVVTVTCQGMEFWLKDGFWEFRFLGVVANEDGVKTFFLKIAEHDLLQVVGQGVD